MSDAKHTPGPLMVEDHPLEEAGLLIVEGGKSTDEWRFIAEIFPGTDDCDVPYEEALANARLFSAAPELLEALQIIFYEACGEWSKKPCGHGYTCVCGGDKARAAIAKATGGAQ